MEAVVLENAEVRDNLESHNEGLDLGPLFESEVVSDADLKGESTTEESPATSEPSGEQAEKTEQAAEKEEATPEEKTVDKPPAGYVPHEALKQERQKAQSLKAELKAMQAQIDKLTKPVPEGDRFKDFKPLSVDEFKQLQDDSPDEASVYLYEYNQYMESKANKAEVEESRRQAESAIKELVADGSQEMERVFPGFHSGKNDEAAQVAQYGVDKGLNPDLLFDLTNPGTKIVSHDGTQYILGRGAADIAKFIKSYRDTATSLNETELRKKVEAELRQTIESEAKKQVIDKLKFDDGYKSLDSATTTSDKSIKQRSGTVTESEFARMSPAEQAALLGG